MGIEVEDYCACWIEITVDEPRDIDAKLVVLLGTDFQYRLNGRRVTLRKTVVGRTVFLSQPQDKRISRAPVFMPGILGASVVVDAAITSMILPDRYLKSSSRGC